MRRYLSHQGLPGCLILSLYRISFLGKKCDQKIILMLKICQMVKAAIIITFLLEIANYVERKMGERPKKTTGIDLVERKKNLINEIFL